jgi:hypothetical protein
MATSENKTATATADIVFAHVRNIVCFLLLDEFGSTVWVTVFAGTHVLMHA